MLLWACDIIPTFVLRQDLTFSENILLNYLIITEDKAKAIWMSMNFIARSAAQRALANLTTKYKIVDIDEFGKATILRQFQPNTIMIPINNRTWRPSKLSKANLIDKCWSTSTTSAS